jgi:hypothetical protein
MHAQSQWSAIVVVMLVTCGAVLSVAPGAGQLPHPAGAIRFRPMLRTAAAVAVGAMVTVLTLSSRAPAHKEESTWMHRSRWRSS